MGSYWRYGRSVVQLGRRLLPPLYSEDYNTDFKDKGYVSLVRSVLDFTVTLGNAANKLPAPKTCMDSWLSVWLPPRRSCKRSVQRRPMEKRPASHGSSPLPLMRTIPACSCLTTSSLAAAVHTANGRTSPSRCSSTSAVVMPRTLPCMTTRRNQCSFCPTWPSRLSEVITDPFYVMSTAELVKWLNETHPYRSWQYKRAGQSFGPYPRLAQAVQDRKMDGTLGCVQRDSDNGPCAMLIVFGPAPRPRKGFSAWEVDGEYDMLDLEGAEYRPFFDALASRFEMPPRAGLDDT